MRTRLKEKEYTRCTAFSMDRKSIEALYSLQDTTLLDRSQIVRIILHQLSSNQFEQMFLRERKDQSQKVYFKRKMAKALGKRKAKRKK